MCNLLTVICSRPCSFSFHRRGPDQEARRGKVSVYTWVSYVSRLVLFVIDFMLLESRREGVFMFNSQCLALGWHRAGAQPAKLSLNFMGTLEPPNSTNFIHT